MKVLLTGASALVLTAITAGQVFAQTATAQTDANGSGEAIGLTRPHTTRPRPAHHRPQGRGQRRAGPGSRQRHREAYRPARPGPVPGAEHPVPAGPDLR